MNRLAKRILTSVTAGMMCLTLSPLSVHAENDGPGEPGIDVLKELGLTVTVQCVDDSEHQKKVYELVGSDLYTLSYFQSGTDYYTWILVDKDKLRERYEQEEGGKHIFVTRSSDPAATFYKLKYDKEAKKWNLEGSTDVKYLLGCKNPSYPSYAELKAAIGNNIYVNCCGGSHETKRYSLIKDAYTCSKMDRNETETDKITTFYLYPDPDPYIDLYSTATGVSHHLPNGLSEAPGLCGISYSAKDKKWTMASDIAVIFASCANEPLEMHRLYNPNSGEHFYTADIYERSDLVEAGWKDEGIGWYAPRTSNTPVYRLYNKNGGEHHYTRSSDEKDMLVGKGWTYEGIGWYSDDNETVPVYRQYNPNEKANNHNYTASISERDHLLSLGWKDENIGWYGVR